VYDLVKASPQAVPPHILENLLYEFGAQLVNALVDGVRESARDSVYALERLLGRTLGTAGQLEDHVFSANLRERVTHSSEKAQREMAAKFLGHAFAKIVMTSAVGTPRERASRISEVLDASWWRVQRLARTETAIAFNAVRIEALKALSPAFPAMRQRWTERLDDPEAQVAADSAEMHGQIVKVGHHFFLPPGTSTWAHPPNRPNDSAIVTPWQPGWGVVAWTWAGQKVWHQ
jgi:hypothetical protein